MESFLCKGVQFDNFHCLGYSGCPAVGQVKKVGKVGHFWQKVGQK